MMTEKHRQMFADEMLARLDGLCELFGIGQCESPIEELLFTGFVYCFLYNRTWRFAGYTSRIPLETEYSATVYCQLELRQYRADFAIEVSLPGGGTRWLVVECDGHDFHERTKEQAARDKSRDRAMLADGISVLRFAGSEIHADPVGKAKEVEALIASWAAL